MHATVVSLEEVHLPRGFSFSSATAGIKASGKPDLALVEACEGTTAAAVFTKNRVVAAPLIVGRKSLVKAKGRVRAVLVNSGNANCATGKAGVQACERVCRETAELLGVKRPEVFPSSTGIIGVPLPAEKIVSALPGLLQSRDSTDAKVRDFAQAIMTTDTRMKLASARTSAAGKEFSILGVAKGAGMIHPQLATMLVYLFTDVAAAPGALSRQLRHCCDETFNCISIDGDTSTNDTVLLLASGQSGLSLKTPAVTSRFAGALHAVMQSLAEQIVSDGEGVKHVIRLSIEQARNRAEAEKAAKAIAHSLLVKTAWAGADPNWGRILAAVGYSGVPIEPAKVEIWIARQKVFGKGVVQPFDEKQAHQALSQPKCDITVKLGRGKSKLLFLTTDLTTEYVHINADYST